MAAGGVTPIKSLQDSAVNMEYSIIPVTPIYRLCICPEGLAASLQSKFNQSRSTTRTLLNQHLYYKISGVCVCECWTNVTSPCLHRSYSCGTVSPACKVGSGPLHVYIAPIHAVWYATPFSSSTPGRFKPVILTSLHDMEGSQSFMHAAI